MDTKFPPSLSEEWDRVGLICGQRTAPVSQVLLAVDPTEEVAEEAIEIGAELVITHHPLFLKGTSFVSTDTAKGRVIHRLITHGVALFNAHTNADSAPGGVAEALAVAAGLNPATWSPLEPHREHPQWGIGRIGELFEAVTLEELAQRLAQFLPASPAGLLVSGQGDQVVSRVAVSGGSGQSLLPLARQSGAEVFITADLRHHPALDFTQEGGPALIVPSHWASEWLWLPQLANQLELWAGEQGQVLQTKVSTVISEPWDAYVPTLASDNLK